MIAVAVAVVATAIVTFCGDAGSSRTACSAHTPPAPTDTAPSWPDMSSADVAAEAVEYTQAG